MKITFILIKIKRYMETKNNSIYLIRHAQSKFNEFYEEVRIRGGKEEEYRFNKDLIDCEITELGIRQAQATGQQLRSVNITHVIVSPLRRALQTANFIFQDHPSKPKIKVLPLAREVVGSSCNFHSSLLERKKEFPNFDFSEFDKFEDQECWLIETILPFVNEDREADLRKLTEGLPDGKRLEQFQDNLLELSRNLYPKCIEQEELLNRGEIQRNMKEGDKLAFLAHEIIILAMTATKIDDTGYILEGVRLKNAEYREYDLNLKK